MLNTYYKLFTFKTGPQDLSHSNYTLAILTLATIILRIIATTYGGHGPQLMPNSAIWLVIVLNVLFLGVFTYYCLRHKHLLERFTQTFHGIMATLLAQTILALIFMAIPKSYPQLIMFLGIIISIWALVIFCNIFKHALEIKMSQAVLLVLSFEILQGFIIYLILSGLGFTTGLIK